MAPVVSVEGLRKRYRRRDAWAVDGVSFALEPGQAFGLLGPNGAGKSTVVKIIAGLLRAGEGKVTLFGSDPGNPTARKDLGFAPEDPDFPKFLREPARPRRRRTQAKDSRNARLRRAGQGAPADPAVLQGDEAAAGHRPGHPRPAEAPDSRR